jgi:hypothetical protein
MSFSLEFKYNPMRVFFYKLPEYYLALIILMAAYTPPFSFHPFFLGLAFLVILQIIFQKRISGMTMGVLFFLANLFFLGALISEFLEFTEFDSYALQLILVGVPLWILNAFAAAGIMYKYSVKKGEITF